MNTRQRKSAICGGSLAESGFTMLEILVSTLLGSFLLAGFMAMATFQVSATRDQSTQVELQQAVRSAADLFAREVRRAGSNPTCSPNVRALDYATGWMIYLNSDLNGDGAINFNTESIIYQHDVASGVFRRIANGRLDTLVDNMVWEDSRMLYFDANGAEIHTSGFSTLSSTDRNRVRRIQLLLTVERRSPDGEIVRAQASSDVSLRNRFFVEPAGC